MDNKNFTIGILSTTAVILLVGYLIMATRPQPVFADGMTTSGGDFVLTVGGVAIADEEYVYVLHAPSQRLIAYRFDTGKQRIEVAQGIELSELRDKPSTPGQQRGRTPARGRGRRP